MNDMLGHGLSASYNEPPFHLYCIGIYEGPSMVGSLCFHTYSSNYNYILFRGQIFPGFTFTRGVKQGCPLPARLFVYIFDMLLRCLEDQLHLKDGVVAGVADDLVFAIEDIWLQLPTIVLIMAKMARCRGNGHGQPGRSPLPSLWAL